MINQWTAFFILLLLSAQASAWELRYQPEHTPIAPAVIPDDPEALPDAEVAIGTGKIRQAWLVMPTTRYDHGVLGDAVEAAGVRVVLDDGSRLTLELPMNSVFEDRYPRLLDLDGDGVDELFLVRSYIDKGAALTVIKLSHGALRILVQTAPIGQAYRWLNPVGGGDLDGDGKQEIAVVETPHIGGILKVYEHNNWSLSEEYRLEGFSNHSIGSRQLGQSTLMDLDGDGLAEMLVPSVGRNELRVITLAGKRIKELHRFRHDSVINTAISKRDVDGDGDLDVTYGLADGRQVELLLP